MIHDELRRAHISNWTLQRANGREILGCFRKEYRNIVHIQIINNIKSSFISCEEIKLNSIIPSVAGVSLSMALAGSSVKEFHNYVMSNSQLLCAVGSDIFSCRTRMYVYLGLISSPLDAQSENLELT